MPENLAKLILSIGLCLGAGILGSFFTISSIPNWYSTLNKPFFSPPNWVFGPVWTILYILMGYSLYLVWEKKKVPSVFWIQLILSALWSIIFFGLKNTVLALLNNAALWITIVLNNVKNKVSTMLDSSSTYTKYLKKVQSKTIDPYEAADKISKLFK